MTFLKFFQCSLFALIIIVTYTSCSEKESNPQSPADAFAEAREYYDDENFELALQKLGQFKSRFPYSKFAVLAELFIANSHFELGNYEEAAIEYKQFVRLHPKHEKNPFVMFRVGESYWIDAPEEIDRDQELTQTAIDEWKNLVRRYPQSQYAKRAKIKMKEGNRRIAESHRFVADFYCKMEIYHACAYRFIQLLETYPQYPDLKKHALLSASEAFSLLADIKKEEPQSDKNIFFKSMGEGQLRAKSLKFKKLAAKIRLPKEK